MVLLSLDPNHEGHCKETKDTAHEAEILDQQGVIVYS
jgi:hypothetical protein